MSSADLFLWIALPYVCLAIFFIGNVWRYRRDRLTWTARPTPQLEQKGLRVSVLLFHFGVLAVIGGHVLGVLVPPGVTSALGISEHAYHRIAVVAGGTAGTMMSVGFALLLFRRITVPRIRATTRRSDLVMYPVLTIAIVTGMVALFGGNLVDSYDYREVVSPWFRGIFLFRPHAEEMAGAPFLFQFHVTCVWLLYAVFPFSRLVHAWSIPLMYLRRSWILFRSPRAALAFEGRGTAQQHAEPGRHVRETA